jgi:hypothetical protein
MSKMRHEEDLALHEVDASLRKQDPDRAPVPKTECRFFCPLGQVCDTQTPDCPQMQLPTVMQRI